VQAKGVDHVKLVTLNGIATRRDHGVGAAFNALLDEVDAVRDGGEDGPWVLRLPERLVAALAEADSARLAAINDEWSRTEEWELDGVRRPDDTRWLVEELAALARDACSSGRQVYLWLSV
jgi:hypothetical protein